MIEMHIPDSPTFTSKGKEWGGGNINLTIFMKKGKLLKTPITAVLL